MGILPIVSVIKGDLVLDHYDLPRFQEGTFGSLHELGVLLVGFLFIRALFSPISEFCPVWNEGMGSCVSLHCRFCGDCVATTVGIHSLNALSRGLAG